MTKKLKDSTVKNSKPNKDGSPANYADGGGLFLYVTHAGKYRRYRYRIAGKVGTYSFGNYPEMSLKEAREHHEAARALVNPSYYNRHLQALERQAVKSFQAIALEWMERNASRWSNAH